MWCAVHRSNLAWGDLTKNVGEVKRIINDAKAVATYFHTSGLRTEELKKSAEENGMDVLHFPTYFELFIRHNMPPIAQWDQRPATYYWMTSKERRPEQNPCKAKEQKYFKGVFF